MYLVVLFCFRCALTRSRQAAFTVAFYLNSETCFMSITAEVFLLTNEQETKVGILMGNNITVLKI